ncbi:MAG: hypothetical protein ISR91_07900 [Candidatus Delongbacteria bacterium]|nr:hypothetical protein [Candidatus Delongbacteria bacterium]
MREIYWVGPPGDRLGVTPACQGSADAVRAFISLNGDRMSGLTRREATRHL